LKDRLLTDLLSLFKLDDLLRVLDVHVFRENGLVEVKQSLYHFTDAWLVYVLYKFAYDLLVGEDVLEDVSGVAAYQHSEEVGPVGTEY
jgi:hypothetical protein